MSRQICREVIRSARCAADVRDVEYGGPVAVPICRYRSYVDREVCRCPRCWCWRRSRGRGRRRFYDGRWCRRGCRLRGRRLGRKYAHCRSSLRLRAGCAWHEDYGNRYIKVGVATKERCDGYRVIDTRYRERCAAGNTVHSACRTGCLQLESSLALIEKGVRSRGRLLVLPRN